MRRPTSALVAADLSDLARVVLLCAKALAGRRWRGSFAVNGAPGEPFGRAAVHAHGHFVPHRLLDEAKRVAGMSGIASWRAI
jgi:hypothetical protein